ncbi:MAG TPA: hypothetical protein VGM77_11045 [Gemmatimonadales bacterium]|jgi:hypothetical protein
MSVRHSLGRFLKIVAFATVVAVTVPSAVVAQGVTPPSASAVARLPQPPTPRSPYVSNGSHADALRAMSHRRDTVIRLSTVAVVIGVVVLVLLLV